LQQNAAAKTGNNREYIALYINTSTGIFSVGAASMYKTNGSGGSTSGTYISAPTSGAHTYPLGPANIILDMPKKILSVNGDVQEFSGSPVSTTTNAQTPFLLAGNYKFFGREASSSVPENTTNRPGAYPCVDVRFRELKIYESDADSIGALVHHLLPMQVADTGLIGVCDVVTNTAYTAYTDGTITAGPEI
ncbi:MAG: hypothetical protein K2N78_12605, partial [Oscillospiraceae bacterium]|nr:hypothetical protein [Oscillospiraceae bacterium]